MAFVRKAYNSLISPLAVTIRCLSTTNSLYQQPKLNDICIEEKSENVFNVQLNRPESRNAFTVDLWNELGQTFGYLSELPECRAIVISGNGASFCAGIDLNGLKNLIGAIKDDKLDVARKSRYVQKLIKTCQDSYTSMEKCRKPVIAALHGHCIGAATSLISCCDVRYTVGSTIFSIKEVDIGIAADVGVLQRIQKIVGNDSWAREVAFTAREFSGEEALKFGLVSRVFDSQEACFQAAFGLAKAIALKSPIAVQGTKLAMNYARDHSVDDSLEWMRNWSQSQLQTEDIVANAMARAKKEMPKFRNV
jgi:enoyl-CoA hydratase/carnithine racemase